MSTKYIHSKIEKDKLLHVVFSPVDEFADDLTGFKDITPHDKNLQMLVIRQNKEKTYIPHYHLVNERFIDVTNESWIVIKGKVKAILFDTDNSILCEEILNPGDCSITFEGAHTYEILEDDTVVYEVKNGPYNGVEKDRRRIV